MIDHKHAVDTSEVRFMISSLSFDFGGNSNNTYRT